MGGQNVVDLTITDIPYDMVNRPSNGLRNLDKGNADIITFNLQDFLENIYKLTKGTCIVFCGVNQVSDIYKFFAEKEGTVRQLIWKKTNPSPMNGQYIYLSGIENAFGLRKKELHLMHIVKIQSLNMLVAEVNCTQQKRTMI